MLRLDSITSKEPAARIILYPRVPELDVSPYRGAGCYDNWVEVQLADCPEGSESARVLVVTPNSEEVGCTITHDRVSFHLYLDPDEDRLIFQNACTYQALNVRLETKSVKVGPKAPVFLYKGSCAIEASGITFVEFEILPRPSWEIAAKLATKRPAPESDSPSPKRVKRGESTCQATKPARGLQAVLDGNALVRLGKGDTMYIGTDDERYRLTRYGTIAEQPNSSVWQAEHSAIPGGTVVVKIIRTTGRSEGDTLQAIRAWIHESEIHSSLKSHSAILRMLGSDARFHSIFTEHIEAKSLLCQRTPDRNHFIGDNSDTQKILADMASALAFVHDSNIVHNDVKPGNILYSPSRGAVLIDFGLSFRDGHPSPGGGSPWYLPPEFTLDWNYRGLPSDIWALGIVGLWLLDRIPLPETTPRWSISNIHLAPDMKAIDTMTQWLELAEKARSKLDQEDPVSCIVRDLLEPDMVDRVDAATLNKRLAEEGLLQDGKVE
ncbi:putative serine/threonine-protein kinase KIN1-like protein [Penicillium chrysogenum]|nr:putative serine/threonine-protein kinase KIN1-like protein [Penicillium chrysogenum]